MAQVLKVDINMRRTKSHVNSTFGRQNKKVTSDEMDWEPTRAHSGRLENDNRRQAVWQTQEEIDRRRANNLCIRCGAEGHYTNRCKLAPARRPGKTQARAATVTDTNSGPKDHDNASLEN